MTIVDAEIIDLAQYDTIPVSAILNYLYMMGIVTDVNDPNNIAYTMEAFNNQPVLTVPVIRGGPGLPGPNAITLQFENRVITDLDALPTDLGDTEADLGRFWLYPVVDLTTGDKIATIIYLWTGVKDGPLSGITGLGQGWVQIPIGIPGPPGPYANLSGAQLVLTQPGVGGGPLDTDSWVAVNDNSIQYITVNGTLTAGLFRLIVNIGGVANTTGTIAFNNISAASLQSALAALGNVGAGNVVVTGSGPYTVTFSGPLDSQGIQVMVVTGSTLVGGTVTVKGGTADDPAAAFYIAVPQGVQGQTAPLGSFYNVDFETQPPKAGDVFTCSARLTPGAPTTLTATGSTTGGALPAGTHFYKVTATMPNGETLASNEVSVVTTGSTSSVHLTWNAPNGSGATGFNVYRGTAAGVENALVAVVISGTQTSLVDVGGLTVPASPPTTSSIIAGQKIWVPVTPLPQSPLLFTVPQTAFVADEFGLAYGETQPTVGTFDMPQQPFAWVPYVSGAVQVDGTNFGSTTPLLIGANVLLGNASSGQIVSSGLSDAQGVVTMFPDFGSLAFSHSNFGGSVVPAYHTGKVGTLYVNLVNEGWFEIFKYTNAGSQLSVLVMPILNTVAVVHH
jgi:hypothetical protein